MEQSSLCNNLNFLMVEKDISASSLARETNLPLSSIKKIRNGSTPNPTIATLLPIARYFNVALEEMLDNDLLAHKIKWQEKKRGPVSLAHLPVIAWEEVLSWPDVPTIKRHIILSEMKLSSFSFVLRVNGEDLGLFSNGGLLLMDPEATPSHRDYVLVHKKEMTFPYLKRLLIEGDKKFIQSVSIEKNIDVFTDEFNILGVLIEYRQTIKR